MADIFERAAKKKIRFNGGIAGINGVLNTEDLFDLSKAKLDKLFIGYNRLAKDTQEEGLLSKPTPATTELNLQVSVIRHVFDYKVAQEEANRNAQDTKAHNQKIDGLIAAKEDQEMAELSVEDLRKLKIA